jgi:hypothetical protein
MTPKISKKHKEEMVRELCGGITADIISRIRDDKVPDEWGSLELMKYIEDRFSMADWADKHFRDDKKARAEYYNALATRELAA